MPRGPDADRRVTDWPRESRRLRTVPRWWTTPRRHR